MNNEESKLILQAYRPGGEDAGDPFFSDALEQARRDPGLGRWFAGQRTFDDSMQQALQAEAAPPGLRDALRLTRKITVFPKKQELCADGNECDKRDSTKNDLNSSPPRIDAIPTGGKSSGKE